MTKDTRPAKDSEDVKRRRVCVRCGHRWNTIEITQDFYERLLKRPPL